MPDLLLLLAQIAGVLVLARLMGALAGLVGQPKVMGEMVAGIMLGPSLLGWLAPGLSAALFPPDSLGFLSALSQIGLLFFMFLVGLELDPRLMRGQGHAAVVTSHASIIAPFALGSVLALYLYPRLSDDSVSFTAFALFLGAAMSVTAFPVLARVLAERGLMQTRLGAVTIATAAVDDVSAWCILAVVIVVVRAQEAAMPIPLMIGGTAVYVVAMVTVIRWALRGLERG
ncbi:MAG TPA: cation:proton antiporter, partial [Gemmatimonadales bacterium]|nr:cation:proton antiporter [Gemmatimonadales bacterium]